MTYLELKRERDRERNWNHYNGLFPLPEDGFWTRILTQISCTVQDFSTSSDSDSDSLIQMYGIGMEISPWDGDLSLKWVQ